MARRRQKDGGGRGVGERFVPIVHSVIASAAWRTLPPIGRALFFELRVKVNLATPAENNGRIYLSVREVATALQTTPRRAREAFYELQRRGFIVVTELGHLGAEGHGRATLYRLTDCGCREHPRGSREFLRWQPGADFPVAKAPAPTRRKPAEAAGA